MIRRRTVAALGASQLVCWGVSYYLIGALAPFIAAELGWSAAWIHGGFSVALAVMGLTSPLIGRLIDRHGGAPVMAAGSIATALGCAGLALAHDLVTYYLAWLCLGVAMRLTLYDAAFAALARLGGARARPAMAQITLLGGLASTVFWPLGHSLASAFGWRATALVYAGLGLLTVLLHLAIPAGRGTRGPEMASTSTSASAPRSRIPVVPAALYALIMALAAFLNSGLSAHLIGMLEGLGVAAIAAVWIASLRGVGQTSARMAEILFGARIQPLTLGVLAGALLPVCFAVGLLSGHFLAAGASFALLYGAGNGLLTIVRGTAPLVLFEHHVYGAVVGRLLVPSFFLSALAPLAYALVFEHLGARAALALSATVGALICLAALWLRLGSRARSPADE